MYVILKKRTLVPRTNWYGFEDDKMAPPCDTCGPASGFLGAFVAI